MQLIFEQTLSQQVNFGDEREWNKNKLLTIETLNKINTSQRFCRRCSSSPSVEVFENRTVFILPVGDDN